jgi:proteasome alpha subunit
MEVPSLFGATPSYDIALTTFSPDGRLFQVEYAYEAVRKGAPIIGIRAQDGVVLAAALRRQQLQEPSHIDKIFEVDDAIGVAIAGLSADARTLVRFAREQAQIHRLTFAEPIPLRSLAKKISDHVQTYTQYGGVRPFGVSLLLIGVDAVPQLYLTTPIGAFWSYKAHAVGIGSEQMSEALEQRYSSQISVEESLDLVLKLLKAAGNIPLTPDNVALAYITTTEKKFTRVDSQVVEELLKSA